MNPGLSSLSTILHYTTVFTTSNCHVEARAAMLGVGGGIYLQLGILTGRGGILTLQRSSEAVKRMPLLDLAKASPQTRRKVQSGGLPPAVSSADREPYF